MNEILVIIPAREGSKRVKNKNIRIIKGKPLIYWSIKYAKKYVKNENIIVSSDSKIICEISKSEKIQFLKRPKNISGDKSNVYSTIKYVLKKIKNKFKYKYVALLQPTSPIRPKNMIAEALELLKKNKKFENLIHLEKTNYNIGSLSKENEWQPFYKKINRTQEIFNQFKPSGCLFLYKVKNIDDYKRFIKRKTYGFIGKKSENTVNIDTEDDFYKLEYIIKKISSKL